MGIYNGPSIYNQGGGGGSSYISGYSGCVTHSSGKVFTNGYMERGNNTGNGKAKLTYVGP